MRSGITTTRQKQQRLPALLRVAWSWVLVGAPLQQGLAHLTGTSRSAHTVPVSYVNSFPGCMVSSLFWAGIRHKLLVRFHTLVWGLNYWPAHAARQSCFRSLYAHIPPPPSRACFSIPHATCASWSLTVVWAVLASTDILATALLTCKWTCSCRRPCSYTCDQ